ncbi:MAG: site-specific integrase, partial [Deltaproteobacteria bacterium]|nr:site-specific integrase [Deltaproteobacteria bacterium]
MTLFDLMEKFIHYLGSQRGYSEHTLRNYRADLRHFSGFLIQNIGSEGDTEIAPELDSIDFLVVREYLGSLYGRYKRSTIARRLSTIRSFFYFIERNGLGSRNPAADISTPKQEKYIPTYLQVDEMFRLLELPDREKPLGLRDLAIME